MKKLTHWNIVRMDNVTKEKVLFETNLTKYKAKKILNEISSNSEFPVLEGIGVNTNDYYYGIGLTNESIDKMYKKNMSDEIILKELKGICELNLRQLRLLVSKLSSNNIDKNSLLKALKDSTIMLDRMNMKCIWFYKTFYLYVINSSKELKKYDFGESDNERVESIENDKFIVLVVV